MNSSSWYQTIFFLHVPSQDSLYSVSSDAIIGIGHERETCAGGRNHVMIGRAERHRALKISLFTFMPNKSRFFLCMREESYSRPAKGEEMEYIRRDYLGLKSRKHNIIFNQTPQPSSCVRANNRAIPGQKKISNDASRT